MAKTCLFSNHFASPVHWRRPNGLVVSRWEVDGYTMGGHSALDGCMFACVLEADQRSVTVAIDDQVDHYFDDVGISFEVLAKRLMDDFDEHTQDDIAVVLGFPVASTPNGATGSVGLSSGVVTPLTGPLDDQTAAALFQQYPPAPLLFGATLADFSGRIVFGSIETDEDDGEGVQVVCTYQTAQGGSYTHHAPAIDQLMRDLFAANYGTLLRTSVSEGVHI